MFGLGIPADWQPWVAMAILGLMFVLFVLERTPVEVTAIAGAAAMMVLVTRGDGFAFAYVHTGRTFTLQLAPLGAAALAAWWFNPRTGEATAAGSRTSAGSATAVPPAATIAATTASASSRLRA